MSARFTGHTADLSTPAAIEAAIAGRFKVAAVPGRDPDGAIVTDGGTYRRWGPVIAFGDRAYRVDGDYLAAHLFGRLSVVA